LLVVKIYNPFIGLQELGQQLEAEKNKFKKKGAGAGR